jgi:hypothetical protein
MIYKISVSVFSRQVHPLLREVEERGGERRPVLKII